MSDVGEHSESYRSNSYSRASSSEFSVRRPRGRRKHLSVSLFGITLSPRKSSSGMDDKTGGVTKFPNREVRSTSPSRTCSNDSNDSTRFGVNREENRIPYGYEKSSSGTDDQRGEISRIPNREVRSTSRSRTCSNDSNVSVRFDVSREERRASGRSRRSSSCTDDSAEEGIRHIHGDTCSNSAFEKAGATFPLSPPLVQNALRSKRQSGSTDSSGLSSLQNRVARLRLEGSVSDVLAEASNVTLEGISFNQDGSCFTASTSRGFRVYTTSPLSEFLRLEEVVPVSSSKPTASSYDLLAERPRLLSKETPSLTVRRADCENPITEGSVWPCGGVKTAAMLFKTNIFALVFKCDTKKIKFWDDRRKRFIGELRSRLPVSNVVLARDIIAMVTEFAVYVYLSEQMKPVHIIHTASNQRGLCVVASSPIPGDWLLACPAVAVGAVRVHVSPASSTGDPGAVGAATSSHVFQAHRRQLAALAFSPTGTLIATASEKGTVVRLFRATDGVLLQQLRRGSLPSLISCIAIRADAAFAAVASNSDTVHIFNLVLQQPQPEGLSIRETGIWTGGSTASGRGGGLGSAEVGSFGFITPATGEASGTAAAATAKELTSALYGASKDVVQDALKGVLGGYFGALRSFAQFRLPRGGTAVVDGLVDEGGSGGADLPYPGGPLVCFSGPVSNHLYAISPRGLFFELRFNPNKQKECVLLNTTTWFAPRPDFQIQVPEVKQRDRTAPSADAASYIVALSIYQNCPQIGDEQTRHLEGKLASAERLRGTKSPQLPNAPKQTCCMHFKS